MSVRVIAGLGNPGPRYDGTRHNAGFAVLDALASELQASWKEDARYRAHTASVDLAGRPVLLVKPQTFMNDSGLSLGEVCRYLKLQPDNFLVVYDEFQIPVGRAKLSIGGGPGGHNGVSDLIARLGDRFVRYRVGIGPEEKPLMPIKDFVLGRFSEAEKSTFQSSMKRHLEAIRLVIDLGPGLAMNHINQRPRSNESDSQPKLPCDGDPRHPGIPGSGGNPDRET